MYLKCLWLFGCLTAGRVVMLDRTGLDLVNVIAGSFPVRIPTQEPAENLCPPWHIGGIQRCWRLLGLEREADMCGNIEAIASRATGLL